MKLIEIATIAKFIEKIRKFNLLPLFLTNLYLATISTFYVYVAATALISLPALALAVSLLVGAGNLLIALIVSYNTLAAKNLKHESQKVDFNAQNRNLTIFLFFAILAFALNFITNLVGPYISLPLVAGALSLPAGSPWFIGVCIFIGAFTAIAFGLYNIVQIYEVCQRIKPSLNSIQEKSGQNNYIPLCTPTASSRPLTELRAGSDNSPKNYSFQPPSPSLPNTVNLTSASPSIS